MSIRTLAVRCLPLLVVVMVALATSWLPRADARALARHEASRMSMACLYEIVAHGHDAGALPVVVEQAFDEIDRIDRLMSHYRPDSPLSLINRGAADGPVAVEPELYDFIAAALRYSRESDGAFDITVGPLMKAWGFFKGDGRMPTDAEVSAVRTRIGYEHVVLDRDNRTIRFDVAGVELDLGGIAKGYAVDRAVRVLERGNVSAALVSAGGSTIYAYGAPPGQPSWEVDIQDPLVPDKTALTVPLRDRALSVAGSSEKFFEIDGSRYSHIMDPRTGRPAQGVLTVVVLASSGTDGDALDDAFFVRGVDKTRARLADLTGTEAYFFLPHTVRGWEIVHLQ